jgi:hypothetical protein
MPNDLIKSLAIRFFSTATQLQTALSVRAPIAAARATEILKIISTARQAYRQAAQAAADTGSIDASTPRPASDKVAIHTIFPISTAPKAKIVDDVWDNFASTSTTASPAKKPAASSSLFGSTIKSNNGKPTPTSSKVAVSKGKNSALFGKTIKSSARKATSPSFEDVTRQINLELAPVPRPVAIPEIKPAGASVPIGTTAKETVPVSNGFSSIAPATTTTEQEKEVDDKPSPPKRPKTDQVVQVKKKNSKSKSASKPAPQASTSEVTTDATAKATASSPSKPTESKKSKKRTAEVPEFDYTKAPNLLDNPRSGVKDQGKKKKTKEKKERKGMYQFCFITWAWGNHADIAELKGADFGPAPKEKSNMRAGNKSGTF